MQVTITKEVYQKLYAYVDGVDSEIGGWGTVERNGENITITDVFILKQHATAGEVDHDKDAIAEMLLKASEQGIAGKIKLQWHSHDTMSAFFSGTDTDNIDNLNNGDWLISLVVNKKREYQLRVDLYKPFRAVFDDLKLNVETETCPTCTQVIDLGAIKPPDKILKDVTDQIKNLVTRSIYKSWNKPVGFTPNLTEPFCNRCYDYHSKKEACNSYCTSCRKSHPRKKHVCLLCGIEVSKATRKAIKGTDGLIEFYCRTCTDQYGLVEGATTLNNLKCDSCETDVDSIEDLKALYMDVGTMNVCAECVKDMEEEATAEINLPIFINKKK